jgi:nitroreductase
VDAGLVIASKREVREYADRAIPEDVRRRILDAGRLAGSAQNRQLRRFVVIEDESTRERLAESVYEPGNVRGAAFIVAIVVGGRGPLAFDAGRAAQNMMLAAWNEGIGSSPNGSTDPEAVGKLLGVGENERTAIVLTFGYPAKLRDPASRTVEEWSRRANRKPLDETLETR